MSTEQLDNTDKQILKILQKDASLTIKEIADKVNKSVAAVHERIKRLKEEGYIKNIVAIVDRKKIGIGLIAFTQVLLHDHAAKTLNEFEKSVIKFSEVIECFQMAGAFDFILRVAAKDIDDYHHFLRDKLAALPNISTVQSFFVLSESKTDSAYPIR